MDLQSPAKSFRLGQTVITRHARERLHPADVRAALQRHTRRDWGDLCPEDVAENNRSLDDGCRLLSQYCDRRGTKFWIITEADRSVTTILLPEDY
ncbi:MAG: hypothetical protein M1608_02795 [Candidatus Omnitrophica bacterium]|nr:hypothetical protein [Candidatus Omnitrophota bacterium]